MYENKDMKEYRYIDLSQTASKSYETVVAMFNGLALDTKFRIRYCIPCHLFSR